jgi:hypothetical protein
VVSPTLGRTIAFVVDHMPAPAEEIEAALRFQRLTSGLFRLEGVLKAAELLGRRLPFSITEVGDERLVHAPDIPSLDTIARIARRLISRWGMTTLSTVLAEVRQGEADVCDIKLVASALACLKDFHWLEQSAGWFWLSDTRHNPVLNGMRKILSVASPIHISQLWAGIGRGPRMRGFSPPERVILEFCRQAPKLQVHDETVQAEPAINSDDVLSQTERDIVQVLSEHGGTMATSEFRSVCLGMGVNGSTFYQNLLRSPIISRYAGSLYGVIGSDERSGCGARVSFPEHRLGKCSVKDRLGIVGNPSVTGFFSPSSFCAPPTRGGGSDFGNSGVGIIRGLHQANFDFSVSKTTRISERKFVQFRTASLNLCNHAEFDIPEYEKVNNQTLFATNASNAALFGVITSILVNSASDAIQPALGVLNHDWIGRARGFTRSRNGRPCRLCAKKFRTNSGRSRKEACWLVHYSLMGKRGYLYAHGKNR